MDMYDADYLALKKRVIDEMLKKLKEKYPEINYIYNRLEFWNGKSMIVSSQDIRDAFPSNYDKDILINIAGHRIASMEVTSMHSSPPPFKNDLMKEN